MTYDKFSRSLRYYYDKGILKKIPGERFVYRFLIDPEVMYEHIGSSDSLSTVGATYIIWCVVLAIVGSDNLSMAAPKISRRLSLAARIERLMG